MTQLRIVVADDNQFMRTAYKRILDTQDEFEVVGMAADGDEALDLALELVPDIAVLDVKMPKKDGIAVAHLITAQHPQTGIVLISAYDDLAFVSAIMKNGASRKAYILKNSLDDISELIRVVEAVSNGQSVLDTSIVRNLLEIYRRQTAVQNTPLSETEEAVLKLTLEGYSVSEISESLGLSLEPVETLAASVCQKLGMPVQDDDNRSPQVVQAIINRCVP
ncbi:MAG: response regulator transcription factor [Chloroflexi bacterium]|nr:response regulator transcription factor [Chloroflexota bacterium]